MQDAVGKLVASLRALPLIVVLRPALPPQPTPIDQEAVRAQLSRELDALSQIGLRYVELAWHDHPSWPDLVQSCVQHYPGLRFGAASITCMRGLEAACRLRLDFATSPVLCPQLLERARQLDLLLVPGVLSPSEVHHALTLGCRIVKLFPATAVGPRYWARLRAPMGGLLPFCIAAGGLESTDVLHWLRSGVDAVALGRRRPEGETSVSEMKRLTSALREPPGPGAYSPSRE